MVALLRSMLTALVVVAATASVAHAHMEMANPPPRGSKKNPATPIDYSLTSPARAICQGKSAGPSVATYTAGGTVNVKIIGGASHNGGTCRFSLSYDGGKTFVVIHEVLQGCVAPQNNISVRIPASAPSASKAIFAWSWVNYSGNSEYYMNCADVTIKGKSGGSVTGKKLLFVNMPGYTIFKNENQARIDAYNKLAEKEPTITVTASGSSSASGGKNVNEATDNANEGEKEEGSENETSMPTTPKEEDKEEKPSDEQGKEGSSKDRFCQPKKTGHFCTSKHNFVSCHQGRAAGKNKCPAKTVCRQDGDHASCVDK